MRKIAFTPALAGAIALVLLLSSCAGQLNKSAEHSLAQGQADKRLLIRTGYVSVSVEQPGESLFAVQDLVRAADGYVERSTTTDTSVSVTCRVPSASLDHTIDQISALGKLVRRSVSTNDVTDQHADISSRLDTSRQLRTRMRELLDRATDVQDLLAIESELARVQAEIESMEAQLERLNSQIELSSLSVTLEQKRVFGPLGFVGYWTGWALSKLFVIR